MIFKLSILFFERLKTHCPYLLRLTVLTLIVLDWLSNKFHHVLQVRNLKKSERNILLGSFLVVMVILWATCNIVITEFSSRSAIFKLLVPI